MRSRFWIIGALLLGAVLVMWSLLRPGAPESEPLVARASAPPGADMHSEPAPAQAAAPSKPEPAATDRVAPVAGDAPRAAVPTTALRAKRKVWVDAKYGAGHQQLGKHMPVGEGEILPPQGFVPLPDGKLLVLDSAKQRLVWFGADGAFERTAELPKDALLDPADVARTDDGTLVVIDRAGVHTKGMIMLDPSGKPKAKLPQVHDGLMTTLYSVGNDIYAVQEGNSSVKLGDTSGSASDETPNVYRNEEDGRVPGLVAPDGKTVISTSIEDGAKGQFSVNVLRGPTPEHVFTRFYQLDGELSAILFAQADAQGRIYVVLHHDAHPTLFCIDGKTGDPTGLVPMPSHTGQQSGTPFHEYSVVPSGGLLAQVLSNDGASYEWFDCH